MEAIQYKINDGHEYLWRCFGPNARGMGHWNGEYDGNGITVNCVFDTVNQTVYEMQAWDDKNDVQYRWVHPGYIEGQAAEAKRRGIDFYQSYDDRKFIDLEVAEDILEKASAIVAGLEYDKRVIVPLELNNDELFLMMKLAHEKDMTLNNYVEYILTQEINRRKE